MIVNSYIIVIFKVKQIKYKENKTIGLIDFLFIFFFLNIIIFLLFLILIIIWKLNIYETLKDYLLIFMLKIV